MKKYCWHKTEWHPKMNKSMQVAGMGGRTREAYSRAMRKLVEHYDKSPELLTEDELLDYFIHRQDVTGWAPATMRICYTGIKFFFRHVFKRDWHLLNIAQARREKRLTAVLSREEVKRIMAKVDTAHNLAYLQTVYSGGLRLQEGLFLQTSETRKASLSTPCAIPMPLICWKPGSISGSSRKTSAMPTSKPP